MTCRLLARGTGCEPVAHSFVTPVYPTPSFLREFFGPVHARVFEGFAKSRFPRQGGSFQKSSAPPDAPEKRLNTFSTLAWFVSKAVEKYQSNRVTLFALK